MEALNLAIIILVIIIIITNIYPSEQKFTPNSQQISDVQKNIKLFEEPNYTKTKRTLPWIDVVSYEKLRMKMKDQDFVLTDQTIKTSL